MPSLEQVPLPSASKSGDFCSDPALPADCDGDGDVDGADFLEIQRDIPSLIFEWQSSYGAGTASSTASSTLDDGARARGNPAIVVSDGVAPILSQMPLLSQLVASSVANQGNCKVRRMQKSFATEIKEGTENPLFSALCVLCDLCGESLSVWFFDFVVLLGWLIIARDFGSSLW